MLAPLEEIHAWIKHHHVEQTVLGAWIYGSRALPIECDGGDIDLLLVLKSCNVRQRVVRQLTGGLQMSVNIVGPDNLSHPIPHANGGFYFTGKLLGPRRLVLGDKVECQRLLAYAFSHMIHPWAMFLLPATAQKRNLTAHNLLSLLFILKLHINPHYLSYFAKWQQSTWFTSFWDDTVIIVDEALEHLKAEGNVIMGANNGVQFASACWKVSRYQRRVLLEYLAACFWQFNYIFRDFNDDFLELYFDNIQEKLSTQNEKAMSHSIDFLRAQLPIEIEMHL